MKKLRLNKLFHWLYAILMLWPFICFLGFILMSTFNSSFDISNWNSSAYFTDFFNQIFGSNCFSDVGDFASGSIGESVLDSITSVFRLLGFDDDITTVSGLFYSLFTHWSIVSLFYLLFDVLMYPINLFHKWIDEGGI